MPLIAQSVPSGAMIEEGQDPTLQVKTVEGVTRKDRDSGYEDYRDYDEDECIESDMEGSIMHRSRPKKSMRVPDLPQRNERRVSKILDNVMLELQSLTAIGKEEDKAPIVERSDPHEHYLSSEEDESLSDDYEDYLSDLDGPTSDGAPETWTGSSRASSRKSQEVMAVAISFQIVGKPQVIEIPISQHSSPRSARNTISMNPHTLSNFDTSTETSKKSLLRRPAPLNLRDSALHDSRRLSIASIASSHSSNVATFTYNPGSSYIPSNAFGSKSVVNLNTVSSLPPRKSSRLASLTLLVTQNKNSPHMSGGSSHPFLNSDPFASSAQELNAQDVDDSPATPKTPTSMAAIAFKRGFQKTLSKARKTSMPKISLAYTAGVVPPRTNSSVSIPLGQGSETASIFGSEEKITDQSIIAAIKRHESMPIVAKPQEGSVRDGDILKAISRGVLPAAAASPVGKERKMSLMGFSRTKSVKAR